MAGTLKSFASALIALVSFVVTAPLRIFLAVFQLLFVAPLELWEQFHGPSEASTAAAAAATAASPPGVGSPPRSPHAGGPHNGSGPILSFGGCGFMYPWQLGVAQFVADTFDCADVRCAGHSAGFAACLTVACGVPVEAHWHALQARGGRIRASAPRPCAARASSREPPAGAPRSASDAHSLLMSPPPTCPRVQCPPGCGDALALPHPRPVPRLYSELDGPLHRRTAAARRAYPRRGSFWAPVHRLHAHPAAFLEAAMGAPPLRQTVRRLPLSKRRSTRQLLR